MKIDRTKDCLARRTTGNIRVASDVESFKAALVDNLCYVQGRITAIATPNDWYMALAYTVRDRVMHLWMETTEEYMELEIKSLSYLSAEFLTGPHLMNNLINLDLLESAKKAVADLGLDFSRLLDMEEEPGLGNGGLGRLAACFIDSLATLDMLAVGYGIRYEFGIFDQEIKDGWQVEITDKWLRLGNPWEIGRPELSFKVKFGGHTEAYYDEAGAYRVRWTPGHMVNGVAFDTPITGYRSATVNLLRLWKAEACESFDFKTFNVGDFYGAVHEKIASENITKVLYPNDEMLAGRELRLGQQYFFVSCSLQDMIRVHLMRGNTVDNFHERYAVQLNDTHPAIAVAELMRLLVDEHHLDWPGAWNITQKTFAYTNHTLLPEALEKWPLRLFGSLLPRHIEIIYEINRRFLDEVRARGEDEAFIARVSLIDESGEKYVRMAHLAAVGSHAINGVAELHTGLLKKSVLKDFYTLWPEKFTNVTNGVTPRRWVVVSNPRLADLITQKIGNGWVRNMEELRRLEEFADDASFQEAWREVKFRNKKDLAGHILARTGIEVDPASMFDVQVKRIHEYKRQLLNVLHIVTLFNRMRNDPAYAAGPRTFLFGGKAAPGYFRAKLIVKLIHSVGEVINAHPGIGNRLKVVFFPDFNVKNGQLIYPAADLSEQISTAGKEASGTGNMKFSMNGALTIGTLDGANVEIREEVGHENFFLFGLTAAEVEQLQAEGYNPRSYYNADEELKAVLNMISSGFFSPGDPGLFRPIVDALLSEDAYLLLADYRSYISAQDRAGLAFQDQGGWTRMSVLNTARMGKFSSDRAIREYGRRVWNTGPVSAKSC